MFRRENYRDTDIQVENEKIAGTKQLKIKSSKKEKKKTSTSLHTK